MKTLKILLLLIISFNYAYCQTADQMEKTRKIVDPILHYSISSYLAFTSTMILTEINEDMELNKKYLFSSTLTLIPILTKELYDKKLKGTGWGWEDIGLGTIGIATGIGLHYFLFDKKKNNNTSFDIAIGSNKALFAYRINF